MSSRRNPPAEAQRGLTPGARAAGPPRAAAFPYLIMGGFVAALLALGLIGYMTFRATSSLFDDSRLVIHTHEVLSAVSATRVQVLEAETAEHRLLMTGEDRYRKARKDALRRLDYRLSTLRALLRDRPDQSRRVSDLEIALRQLAVDREAPLRGTVLDPAALLAGADEARNQFGRVRQELRNMEQAESRLLSGRVMETRASAGRLLIVQTALLLLVFGLLTLILFLVRRHLKVQTRIEDELRRSQERFEVAVMGSSDGIWDWDLDSGQVYFSPRWKEQLGYAEDEIRGEYSEWESRLHPEDRERALATLAAYHEARLPEYSLEHRLRHKDGSYRWILARGVALRDEHGNPYRMSGSHTDITARKEAERQLAEQHRRLAEAMRAEQVAHDDLKQAHARLVQSERMAGLGQLVAGIAHEINNPLAFTVNNLAVLQRDLKAITDLLCQYQEADELLSRDRPELADRLNTCRERNDLGYVLASLPDLLTRTRDGLGRIGRIVGDLRLFARLDEGEVHEADLNAGIRSTVALFRGTAQARDIRLDLDLEPLPRVTCNAAKINQVVLNLLTNAVDACAQGGKVTIRSRSEPGSIRIEVQDNGCGIDPEARERVYDPFYTTKPVGQGTGLGLAVSYGIMQDHGGSISFQSEPGRGTCFTLRLPARSLRSVEPPPPDSVASVDSGERVG